MHCTWLWICECESVTCFYFFRLCHFAWWRVLLYIFLWIWILLILFELYIIVPIYTKLPMRTTIIRLPKLRDISKKWCEGAHTTGLVSPVGNGWAGWASRHQVHRWGAQRNTTCGLPDCFGIGTLVFWAQNPWKRTSSKDEDAVDWERSGNPVEFLWWVRN